MSILCALGFHSFEDKPRMAALAPWRMRCQRCGAHPWARKELKNNGPFSEEHRESLRLEGVPDSEIKGGW